MQRLDRYGSAMRFDWTKADHAQFDSAVELLLEAEHGGQWETFAPDGRGGDQGIDFLARRASSLTIYQLKYYPDGFKSSTQSRKRDVRESFLKALQHGPSVWTLVVPAKLTPWERDYVLGLKAQAATDKLRAIKILDLPKLTKLLTEHPRVRDHLDRDPVLEAVRDYQVETSIARDAEHVIERAAKLAARGSDIDADWDMGIFSAGDQTMVFPVPKPGREGRSPLGVSLDVDPSALDVLTGRSLGYGTGELVQIPHHAILYVQTSGPSWKWFPDGVDIELQPIMTAPPDALVSVEFLDADGRPSERHEGRLIHGGRGAEGHSISVKFYDGLRMLLLLPSAQDVQGSIEVKIDIYRRPPADARDSLALNRLLKTWPGNVRLAIDDNPFLTGNLDNHGTKLPVDFVILEQFADDYDFLQRHAGQRRLMPPDIPVLDRVLARVARIVLDGGCAFLPPPFTLGGTLSIGPDRDVTELRGLLTDPPAAVVLRTSPFFLTVCDLQVDVGPAYIYGPDTRIRDAESLIRALDEGSADSTRFIYEPSPQYGWRVMRLDMDKSVTDDASLIPTPWDAVDVDEHGALGPALAASAATSSPPRSAGESEVTSLPSEP
jgi:hypothetical protein